MIESYKYHYDNPIYNMYYKYKYMEEVYSDEPSKLPLSIAIETNDIDKVTSLLESGHDPNEKDPFYGIPPLMRSLSFNYLDIIEILLKYGADVNYINEGIDDLNPLIFAIDFAVGGIPDHRILKLLLQYGADPNIEVDGSDPTTPLLEVEQLINDPNINQRSNKPEVAKSEYLEMVKYLLIAGADPFVLIDDLTGTDMLSYFIIDHINLHLSKLRLRYTHLLNEKIEDQDVLRNLVEYLTSSYDHLSVRENYLKSLNITYMEPLPEPLPEPEPEPVMYSFEDDGNKDNKRKVVSDTSDVSTEAKRLKSSGPRRQNGGKKLKKSRKKSRKKKSRKKSRKKKSRKNSRTKSKKSRKKSKKSRKKTSN